MRHALLGLAALFPLTAPLHAAPPTAAIANTPASTHAQFVKIFADWRAFNHPAIVRGRPDYSAATMARRAARSPTFRTRLAAIDRRGWSASELGDARLVEAEVNGLDFFHRVLRPWARDPGFYQTVFAEMSDVPAHEGPSAEPNIDLHTFAWPLAPADDARLTELLAAVPARSPMPASTSPAAKRTTFGPMETAPLPNRPKRSPRLRPGR